MRLTRPVMELPGRHRSRMVPPAWISRVKTNGCNSQAMRPETGACTAKTVPLALANWRAPQSMPLNARPSPDGR